MTINKPVTVAKTEFVSKLVELTNESGLPYIILEPIFKEFHEEVSKKLDEQTKNDLIKYKEDLQEQLALINDPDKGD